MTESARRALWWLLGGLAALAVIGAALWLLWVPNWRPPLSAGERYGIDVSAHQGLIDWERVAADDIEFAYVKATEGADFVDDRFDTNWSGAGAAGIERGAYHFFTLCAPPVEQARNFLATVRPDSAALPPAVDLELAGNCSERPSAVEVSFDLARFLKGVEKAWGREAVLYVGDDWESTYPVRERFGRPLWLRRFLLRPDGDWLIWQLHGYAIVDGIEGGVDLDVMRSP